MMMSRWLLPTSVLGILNLSLRSSAESRQWSLSQSHCDSSSSGSGTGSGCCASHYDCHPRQRKRQTQIDTQQGRVFFATEVLSRRRSLNSINNCNRNGNKSDTDTDTEKENEKDIDIDTHKGNHYDVAVVGAGVVGSSIAYRLSMLKNLRVLLLDEHLDVGEGTSKGNSAIIHTGFDAEPNTLESRLLQEASAEWPSLAKKLKIPYRSIGALLIATNEAEELKLKEVIEKAKKNNVMDCSLLTADEVKRLEPNVNRNVLGGVLIPREAIADPFATSIAYAEVAVLNGVDVCFGARVDGIRPRDKHQQHVEVVVKPSKYDCPVPPESANQTISFTAGHVINAGGLGSRQLASTYDAELLNELELNPRRGQFLVVRDGTLVNKIILPMPNEITKGILVTPTIFGNTLCGPTAEDLPADACFETPKVTTSGLDEVRRGSANLVPAILDGDVVTAYAGHRCNRKGGSYYVAHDLEKGITTISGVRSTGLSTSPAFSRKIVHELFPGYGTRETAMVGRKSFPSWYEHFVDGKELVCSYEKVTEQDVIEALRSPLRPHTLDSIKRRTRVLMGPCQGADCQDKLVQIISQETGNNCITKCGCQSVSFDVDQ